MKKNFKLLLTVVVAVSIGFASCSEDEDTTPTPTPTPTDAGINTYTAKIFGDQVNNSAGSFFATSNGTVYTQAQAKANDSLVDLLYYYGATNKATIANPTDASAATIFDNATTGLQTWVVKNNTQLRSTLLTAEMFNAISADSTLTKLYTASAIGTALTATTDLAAGDVIAFKTVKNKSGFLKVVNIVENNGNADYITVDVKIQK